MNTPSPTHFNGKEAVDHVAEAQAQGIIATSEIHGSEIPGHISAATDAARETAIALLLLWTVLTPLNIPLPQLLTLLAIFSIGWLVWKGGRSAWLAWSRLERLHRIVEQEKWEIDHNRPQEREELKALYATKGLEGKLLEDVMDVLMADGDRLLKVMVEEELGLSLQVYEHPLKQGLGAIIGAFLSAALSLALLSLSPIYGILAAAFLILLISTLISSKHEQNRFIQAVVWNIGLGVLSSGFVYFLAQFFFYPRLS